MRQEVKRETSKYLKLLLCVRLSQNDQKHWTFLTRLHGEKTPNVL